MPLSNVSNTIVQGYNKNLKKNIEPGANPPPSSMSPSDMVVDGITVKEKSLDTEGVLRRARHQDQRSVDGVNDPLEAMGATKVYTNLS